MHCCKLTLYAISSKTNEPNLTNWQKTYFRAQFWPLRPKFKPQIFFRGFHPYQMLDNVAYKLSLNAISKKNNKPNKENGKKTSFGPNFGSFGPNSGRHFFFFFFFVSKIWLRQSLDIMVSYHDLQYQKKLMIQSWGNLVVDGRKNGRELFHRTLSDWRQASKEALGWTKLKVS